MIVYCKCVCRRRWTERAEEKNCFRKFTDYEDYNSESISSDTKWKCLIQKVIYKDYFKLFFHSNGQRVLDEEVEASSCQKEN